MPSSFNREDRARRKAKLLVLACAVACLLAGCNAQTTRETPGGVLQGAPSDGAVGLSDSSTGDVILTGEAFRGPPWASYLSSAHPALDDTLTPASTAGEETGVDEDSWDRIRAGLTLPRVSRRAVEMEVSWFRRNQPYLDRVANRARPYLSYIVDEVERRGLPTELALLPVVESAFQPFAYSRARASGLWQFIPATARRYGLRINWWYDGRRDVVDATRAALDYLEKLNADFDGDWLLAVAAYNTGEGNVRRAMRRNRARGKPVDFWSLRLPRETRAYVPRWLAVAEIVARSEHHGVELRPIPDKAAFDIVELNGQIDLAVAAELVDISIEDMYLLNPGFNRWATDPDGPHRLLVPAGTAEAFERQLNELPPERRITWRRHRIESGDTLGKIASQYATSVKALKQANGLRSTGLRAGRSLIVPVASRSLKDYTLSAEVRRLMRRVQPGEGHKRTHVVRSGDSLWLISRRYGVTISRLAAWNGLARNSILRPGQRLVVWQHRPSSTRSARNDTGPVAGSNGVYVVRRGDSLWTIAKRHRVSVSSLAHWNNLNKRAALHPGQKLRVAARASPAHAVPVASSEKRDPSTRPIAYTVRRGDTLWEIARRHDVGVAELRKWNGLRAKELLQPGQTLTVMVPSADEI